MILAAASTIGIALFVIIVIVLIIAGLMGKLSSGSRGGGTMS